MAILDLFCADGVASAAEYFSAVTGVSIAAAGRRSNKAFDLGQSGWAKKSFAPEATVYTGGAWKFTGTPAIADRTIMTLLDDATAHLTLVLSSVNGITGLLKVKDGAGATLGTGTTVIEAEKWYAIETKATIHNSAGVVEVRVGGVVDINLTGQDTQNGSNATANVIKWESAFTASYSTYFMDGYLSDSGFLGDIRCDVALPTADSATHADFTPSTGTDHFALIDEAVPSATDYLSSSTVGHIDTFDVTLAAVGTGIHAVQLQVYASKSDAGARGLSPVVRSNAADYVGAEWTLNESADYYAKIYESDPDDSNPWTETKIANAEFGFKVTA